MPEIIVRALTDSGGAVTLAERTVPSEQHNDHYLAQLIERVRWALIDAERIDSQANVQDHDEANFQDHDEANVQDYDEPMLPAAPSRSRSGAGRAAVGKQRRSRTRGVGEVGVVK